MTQWKPKQLEWEGLEAKTEVGINYYLEQYKDGDYHAFCCAAITEPLDRYDTEQEAKAACQADFERRWQAMSEPQPFWKPIEQCNKNLMEMYLIYNDVTKEIEVCTCTSPLWGRTSPTHYAEIPPLEASNAKV